MTIELIPLLAQLPHNIPLLVVVVLTLSVILVNGWTDAPNAIATCVSTRCISVRAAIIMAAIFNFLGVLVMTLLNAKVAMTIYNMVDFGGDTRLALIALGAALLAIVLWATAAWYFGIPTSESHALIAGISGAAIALQNGLSGIRWAEWQKVIVGLGFSTLFGFGLGYIIVKIIEQMFRHQSRSMLDRWFAQGQNIAAAFMAFMHGAQDGQKFMGIFMLGIFLANGVGQAQEFVIPVWLMIVCSMMMALGTSIGGYRIIKAVGMDMVKMEIYQGFASDMAAAICLLIFSLQGIPVSTTHTKTTAIMGAGAAKRFSSVNWGVVKDMALTWILTFPGCGLIGYALAQLFVRSMLKG